MDRKKEDVEKAAYWGCLWCNLLQILLYGVRSRYWKDKKLIRNFIRKTTRHKLPLIRPRSRGDGHLQINSRWIRHEVQNWVRRLKAEYTGGPLRNTGCHKRWGNSWLAERLSAHKAGCLHSVISPLHVFFLRHKRFITFGLCLEKFCVAIDWALQSTCGTLQIDTMPRFLLDVLFLCDFVCTAGLEDWRQQWWLCVLATHAGGLSCQRFGRIFCLRVQDRKVEAVGLCICRLSLGEVFLNRRAAARYRALALTIPGP